MASWSPPGGRRSEARAPTSGGRTRTSRSRATTRNERGAGRGGLGGKSTGGRGGRGPPSRSLGHRRGMLALCPPINRLATLVELHGVSRRQKQLGRRRSV